MAITFIQTDDGRYGPAVFCDTCGGQIEDVYQGMYSYDPNEAPKPGGAALRFAHKGRCDAGQLHWDELRYLPVRLGGVLRINWEEASAGLAALAGYEGEPLLREVHRKEDEQD
jgi:hypothetical protein